MRFEVFEASRRLAGCPVALLRASKVVRTPEDGSAPGQFDGSSPGATAAGGDATATLAGASPEQSIRQRAALVERVALYFTSPSFWLEGSAAGLHDFLTFVLDSSRAGRAWLGVAKPGDTWDSHRGDPPIELQWHEGDSAHDTISTIHEQVWQPAEVRGKLGAAVEDQTAAFNALLDARFILLWDRARLDACWQELNSSPEASPDAYGEYPPEGYWLGLTCDWARRSGAITWFPQLRVSSYWPQSPAFAPSEPPAPAAPLLPGAKAARLLELGFWKEVETRVRQMREKFALGNAYTGAFDTPVFYAVELAGAPADPSGFFEDSARHDLMPFVKINLAVDDPFADNLSIGVLQGSMGAISRALYRTLDTGDEYRQDYYLLLPEARSALEDDALRQSEIARAADQLAYIHFSAADAARDALGSAERMRQRLRVQLAILDQAMQTSDEILTAVAAENQGRGRRAERDLRRLAREFQPVVERMKLQFTRLDLEIESARSDLDIARHRLADELGDRLSVRRIRFGRQISGADLAPAVVGTEALSALREDSSAEVRRLAQLKATFDGVLAHIDEAKHEQEERQARTLSYLLGFLAAIVALPLLIGDMGWNELEAVIDTHSAVGGAVAEAHTALTWIALAATASGILMLGGYLIWRLGLRGIFEGRLGSLGRLRRSRRSIANIWLSIADKEATSPPGSEAQALLDKDIMRRLAAESRWLIENAALGRDGNPVRRVQARVSLLRAVSELFMQRPHLVALPRTLVFLMTAGPQLFREWVGSETVHETEVRVALIRCGLTPGQAYVAMRRISSEETIARAPSLDELVAAIDMEVSQITGAAS